MSDLGALGMQGAAALAGVVLAKGSVVLVAGFALSRLARSTAAVGAVWLAAFAALALLPAAGELLPPFELGAIQLPHDLGQRALGVGAVEMPLSLGLVLLWGVVALVLILRLAADWLAAARLMRRAMPAKDRVLRVLALARTRLGVGRDVRIVISRELTTPATMGWRAPVLLLPADHVHWPDEQLLGAICHELAHVQHGDWVSHMAERLVCALYWPNPLVHIARRRAAFARELVADDAALGAGVDPREYAVRVLAVARASRPAALVGTVFLSSGGQLDRRVRALFDGHRRREAPTRIALLGALVVMLPFALAAGAVQPWECVPGAAVGANDSSTCP